MPTTVSLSSPFPNLTSPSLMDKVADKVRDLFADKPTTTQLFIARKSRDAVDRAQITAEMPAELSGALSLPTAQRAITGYTKTPRLNYTGIDGRFSFCFAHEDAQGTPRMRSAKNFIPLFEGADYSYRPGQLPPVLLTVDGAVQSVEFLVKTIAKSLSLLSKFPSADASKVDIQETTIADLVRENGPRRKATTWALADAAPQRFEVVKVGGEICLHDKNDKVVYPSSILEKGWKVDGLQLEAGGYVMTPAVEVALPAEFQVAPTKRARPSPGLDI